MILDALAFPIQMLLLCFFGSVYGTMVSKRMHFLHDMLLRLEF